MAKQSSSRAQGVPSLEYSPATERQPWLFELNRPLDDLEMLLLKTYAGHTRTFKQIYEEHSVDRPYTEANYRDTLRSMEASGKIVTYPPAAKRPQRKGVVTFAETVQVTFPRKVEENRRR